MSNRIATQVAILGWVLLVGFPAGALANDLLCDSGPITDRASAGAFAAERGGPDTITLDVTGIPSMDRSRSPNNVVIYLWVGPFNEVIGGGFDVFLQTLVPGSLLSDISVGITNSAGLPGPGFGFAPGALDDFSGGPTRYMREVGGLPPGLPTIPILFDGLVRLEFFDGFDQAAGAPDGLWVSGTLTLLMRDPIPAPGFSGVLTVSLTCFIVRCRRARHRPTVSRMA